MTKNIIMLCILIIWVCAFLICAIYCFINSLLISGILCVLLAVVWNINLIIYVYETIIK